MCLERSERNGYNNEIVYSKGPGKADLTDQLIQNIQLNDSSILKYKGEKYIAQQIHSPITGWTYINLTPFSEISKEVKFLNRITYASILGAAVGSMIIAVYFSRRIIRPIRKMENFAYDIENGNLDTRLHIRSYKEFNHLASVFNHMIKQHQQMIRNYYVLNIRKREAELKVLQAQINPHFLYNSLNSINSYAQQCGNKEIVDMTCALSDILRYSISNAEDLVMIQDELMHSNNYLFIQNIRYGHTIKFIKDIDLQATQHKTVPFILQPLVENALYHGLKEVQEDKIIELSIKIVDNSIILKVTDYGSGISDDKMVELLQLIYDEKEEKNLKKRSGMQIGLRNIHQRIQMVFGDEYGIYIYSQRGSGTCVQVKIPKV